MLQKRMGRWGLKAKEEKLRREKVFSYCWLDWVLHAVFFGGVHMGCCRKSSAQTWPPCHWSATAGAAGAVAEAVAAVVVAAA